MGLIFDSFAYFSWKMLLFQRETAADLELQVIMSYVRQCWPCRDLLPVNLQFHYGIKNDFFVANNLLFKNNCAVVPTNHRNQMLNSIHLNHFDIKNSKNRARQVHLWAQIFFIMRLKLK